MHIRTHALADQPHPPAYPYLTRHHLTLPPLPPSHPNRYSARARCGGAGWWGLQCAVNTDQIRTVFVASKDIILRLNLSKLGLV